MRTLMDWGNPITTAIVRGIYAAIGSGAAAFVVARLADTDVEKAIYIGIAAALGTLGFRGGVEGAYDQNR